MKSGKFWIAVLVAGIVANVLDYVVQGHVLTGMYYSKMTDVFRQDMTIGWLVFGDFVAVLVLAWVYDKVASAFGGGVKGGACCGFYLGVLVNFRPTISFTHVQGLSLLVDVDQHHLRHHLVCHRRRDPGGGHEEDPGGRRLTNHVLTAGGCWPALPSEHARGVAGKHQPCLFRGQTGAVDFVQQAAPARLALGFRIKNQRIIRAEDDLSPAAPGRGSSARCGRRSSAARRRCRNRHWPDPAARSDWFPKTAARRPSGRE